MFRDIRKKKNQISTEAAEQLLREARRGILAVNGREGYPYAIPINYYYDREAQKIYFHGARAGHKVEAIRACDKVCFTVYGGETIRVLYLTVIYLSASLPVRFSHLGSGRAALLLPYRCCSG